MEGHVSAPILGTPAWYAQREIELLARLATQPQAVVQLWLRKVRIQANAQQAAGRPATKAEGSRGAAERHAGGDSKPETDAQAARRVRSSATISYPLFRRRSLPASVLDCAQ